MKMVPRDRPLSAAKSVPTQLDSAMDPAMRPPRLSNCSRDSFSDDFDLQASTGFQSSDFGDLELSSVSNDSSIGTISPTAVNVYSFAYFGLSIFIEIYLQVEVLSCIRHPNMVLLMGACPEYGCLVYEYLEYGSLDDRIFRRGGTPPIPWQTRFKISAEIATALLFLHQTKPEPLVHRDLKPANILLDRNFTSKIADVGLARLVPPSVVDSVTQYRMTSTAGTFCYIDPEYQQTGMLGTKSDIYSLGILLLQVITAKPPMALSHHVERAIDRGTFREMLDPAIHDWPMDEALAFAKIALRCCQLRRKDRPDLGTVVLPQLNRLRRLGQGSEGAFASSLPTTTTSTSSSSSSFSSPQVENVGSHPNSLGSHSNQVVVRSNSRASSADDMPKISGTSPTM